MFEENCEGSLRSSEQHPVYTCQTQSAQAANRTRTQDPPSARGAAIGQVVAEEFACMLHAAFST